ELVYSLLFSLPGAPVLRYGDEIGMGDDLDLPGRLSVRTPMQWSDNVNGGFSTAAASALIRPMVGMGGLGFEKVNVAEQRTDPESLLHFTRRLVEARLACPEIGDGELTILDTDNEHVFAHACTSGDSTVVFLHNLSGVSCAP